VSNVPSHATDELLIIGSEGGTSVGGSLARAATSCGLRFRFENTNSANVKWRIIRAIRWRLFDRSPVYLHRFSKSIVDLCVRCRPKLLLSTGMAPVTDWALKRIAALGVVRANYSTDDPWSLHGRSNWFFRALQQYDCVYTPRQANIRDFQLLGCPRVEYLPFAYDPSLWNSPGSTEAADTETDIFFVGGGDVDRAPILESLAQSGLRLKICGSDWSRFPTLRPYSHGPMTHEEIRIESRRAAITLILVRRSNRDGHVMRSFEAAAMRCCMLVEKTDEHESLLGADGECVSFFSTPGELVARAKALVSNSDERERLANAVYRRVTESPNTYQDRLKHILGLHSAN
jgi:spore maturation protein CgeB